MVLQTVLWLSALAILFVLIQRRRTRKSARS
jgi:hypothetical protein